VRAIDASRFAVTNAYYSRTVLQCRPGVQSIAAAQNQNSRATSTPAGHGPPTVPSGSPPVARHLSDPPDLRLLRCGGSRCASLRPRSDEVRPMCKDGRPFSP
jgi:hypothetical protein